MRVVPSSILLFVLLLVGPGCGGSTQTPDAGGLDLPPYTPPPSGPRVATVQVTPHLVSLAVGQTQQLTATPVDATGNPITGRGVSWSSSATAVATVSGSGAVTGVSAGTATINAGSGGVSGFATVIVGGTGGEVDGGGGGVDAGGGGGDGGEVIPFEVIDLSILGHHVCAIGMDWNAHCWGQNTDGQLGVGDTVDRRVPTLLPDFQVSALSAGSDHTCALQGVGAFCWGENSQGALGVGDLVDRSTPTEVSGWHSFKAIAVSTWAPSGPPHTCALTTEGAAWCWGPNSRGQLGNGTLTRSLEPAPVSGELTFASISVGPFHTCGITMDGAAYCWGDNGSMWEGNGQLGDGTTTMRNVPTPVSGGHTWAMISAGAVHTCGLTTAGLAYCWGGNLVGQVGDGTRTDRLDPTPVSGGLSFQTISAGNSHTCGVTLSGAAYCWGYNSSGMLGDGTTTTRNVPTPVSGGLSFRHLSAGTVNTCGITVDGQAWCWGSNLSGQLGDGTTKHSWVPRPVPQP